VCLYQRYLSLKIEQLSEVFFGIDEQELKKIKIEIKIKFLFFIFLRELYAYKFDDIGTIIIHQEYFQISQKTQNHD